MNNVKEAEQNEDVFIGARVLGEDGVKLVLPTYDVLISQIEQMKSVARNSEKQNSNISRIMKYNREHNNTIAIFGKRGTGKTSVVYTLMDYLLNQNDSNKEEKNIVLPIIEPDNFGDNTKIMGSIVGLIKNEVEEILKEVKSLGSKSEPYFRNCIYVENNPLKQKMDELLEHHMYSDSEYRNIITHNYTDTATHIKKSAHLLIPDINLKHKFWDVIYEIVRLYKNELKKEATIFIFIDDIDLKTTKCKELIESIMQFSSHPNVITILSGDYEILEEEMMLSLIGDENLSEKGLNVDFVLKFKYEENIKENKNEKEEENINKFTIKDRKLELAGNYLKKIIPPSRRHYVVNWNIDNIPNFSFGANKLIDKIYEFYNEDNIFGFKDSESNTVSTKYPYIIFDTTPRGLINVYYNISRIIENDKKSFFDIKLLIDTIIDSSPELLKNKDKFYEFINWGSDFKSTHINYDRLLIKENEIKSLKEYLAYFIIAEMVLHYEKDIIDKGIYYNKSNYYEAKENILTALYYNASIESLCKADTEFKIYSERNEINYFKKNLYDIAITFTLNLEIMDSLRFLNILLESDFKQDYGYENYWKEEKINIKKNNHFFKCIYKFIKIKEEYTKEILKKMKRIENINRNEYNKTSIEINKFFSLINDISNILKEDELIKNKYMDVYDMNSVIDRESKLFGWSIEGDIENSKEYLNNRELIDKILFNSIKEIEKNIYTREDNNEDINNIVKEYGVTKLNEKKLNALKNFIENEENNQEDQIQLMIEIKEKVLREFFELILSFGWFQEYAKINFKYIDFEKMEYIKLINQFTNKSLGKVYNKYDECKNSIKNKNINNNIILECIIDKIIYSELKEYDSWLYNSLKEELINSNFKNLIKTDLSLELFLGGDEVSINRLICYGDISEVLSENNIETFESLLNEIINKNEKEIEIDESEKVFFEYIKAYFSKEKDIYINIIDLIKRSDLFEEIFSKIKTLADNNSVKYGQIEAKEFINAIEENISINLEDPDIKQYIPLIYYIGKLNEFINPDLKSNEEFEEIKTKMRTILKEVSEKSELEILEIRGKFGLDIEDEYQEGL